MLLTLYQIKTPENDQTMMLQDKQFPQKTLPHIKSRLEIKSKG